MRWTKESKEEKVRRLEKWRPWFAWYPVTIGKERVWLEKVYRRTCLIGRGPGGVIWETEYIDTMGFLRKENLFKGYDGLE